MKLKWNGLKHARSCIPGSSVFAYRHTAICPQWELVTGWVKGHQNICIIIKWENESSSNWQKSLHIFETTPTSVRTKINLSNSWSWTKVGFVKTTSLLRPSLHELSNYLKLTFRGSFHLFSLTLSLSLTLRFSRTLQLVSDISEWRVTINFPLLKKYNARACAGETSLSTRYCSFVCEPSFCTVRSRARWPLCSSCHWLEKTGC